MNEIQYESLQETAAMADAVNEVEQALRALQGQTVTVTGTVKRQDSYRDVPQTTLARCKVAIETVAAA